MSSNRREDARPHLALWASVFLQAVQDCWVKEYEIGARYWVNSNDTRPCSFLWLCSLFELDPEQTRGKILGSRTAASELRRRVAAQEKRRRAQIKGDMHVD